MSEPTLIKYQRLKKIWVSLLISLWIVLTSYALDLLKEPVGIPITGSLIVLTLIAPLIYPRDIPNYDAIIFTPLFVSFILLTNVAFSLPTVKMPLIGSLYVIFSTLLLSIVILWNLVTKPSVWELATHLSIFYFLTLTLLEVEGLGLNAYMFIWILALTTLAVRSSKAFLSGLMSLSLSLLVFLGVHYLVPEISAVPHVHIMTPTELTHLYLSVLVSFAIASFTSLLTRAGLKKEANVVVVVLSYLIPLITFVGLFYLSMSVLRFAAFYSYIEFNMASAILTGIIASSLATSIYYTRTLSEVRKDLASALEKQSREIESLRLVLQEMKNSDLWDEGELKSAEDRLLSLVKIVEASRAELSKRLLSTAELQTLRETTEFMERETRDVSGTLVTMYNKSLSILSKSVAVVSATPYSESSKERLSRLHEVSTAKDIPTYIGLVEDLLRDNCLRLKDLVLNTYVALTEQLNTISVGITKVSDIECTTSTMVVKNLDLILSTYTDLMDLAIPRLRSIHSGLLSSKGLVDSLLRKLSKKPLRGLDSPVVVDKIYHELAETPEVFSEPEILLFLKRYASTYNNLIILLNELSDALMRDLGKVALKIKSIYGENVDIEDLFLSRLKKYIDLIKAKVGKESITSPANLIEGFNEILKELPSMLENASVVLERLIILNNLAEHLPLFSDYVMYELTRKGALSVNELPFTTEVSVQLVWILLMSRGDIEVREGSIYLKGRSV